MTNSPEVRFYIYTLFTTVWIPGNDMPIRFSHTMSDAIEKSLLKVGFDISDEYYFSFGFDACTAIARYLNENSEELDGKNLETILEDLEYCESGIEADIYTDDLIAWLASSTNYIKYVDEAVADGSCITGTGLLEFAQEAMKAEIFEMIKKALLENCHQESFYDLASLPYIKAPVSFLP